MSAVPQIHLKSRIKDTILLKNNLIVKEILKMSSLKNRIIQEIEIEKNKTEYGLIMYKRLT